MKDLSGPMATAMIAHGSPWWIMERKFIGIAWLPVAAATGRRDVEELRRHLLAFGQIDGGERRRIDDSVRPAGADRRSDRPEPFEIECVTAERGHAHLQRVLSHGAHQMTRAPSQ